MDKYIPYGRQCIDQDDIDAVVETLKSDWITTGPMIDKFEKSISEFCGVKYATVVSSGTAALHAAMYAAEISDGDEVIVSTMTFVSAVNAIVFQGGIPVFCDVEPDTLLIDPLCFKKKITSKTKAIVAVDYAGQPCDYDVLVKLASEYNLILISDGCHSIGALYHGKQVGTLADITVFSFHAVKNITLGEGGMVVTDNHKFHERTKIFRNHGITTDCRQREEKKSWYYEMVDLGYNYRITDIQCALGVSQLKKLPQWLQKRNEIANNYDLCFKSSPHIDLLTTKTDIYHAHHLYVIKLKNAQIRKNLFLFLRQNNIGVNVHYIPAHYHPFYRKMFKTRDDLCPVAESSYQRILSLPIFSSMENKDLNRVVSLIEKCLK